MEQRCEDSPAGIQLIVTDKVRMIALQAVKNERLVGLRDLEVGEASSVGQVKLSDDSLHAQAGKLGVHFDVDTFVGLNAHDQLVAGDVLENARCNILELHADLGLLLVQGLACFHDEGYAVPTLVLDVGNQRTESGAAGVLGDGIIFLVSRLASVKRLSVLANDDVLGLDGRDGAEDPHLLVTNILSREGDRTLHGEKRKNLQQMVLHDIADDAELVEITTAALGTEWFLECDLDVVDVMPVPGSAEERVAETQDENVLHHLLTEIVVDAENLLLPPVGFKRLLQFTRACQVLAKWFLDLFIV